MSVPTQKQAWSKDEEEELIVLGPHAFALKYTHRTFGAARNKYGELKAQGRVSEHAHTIEVKGEPTDQEWEDYFAHLEIAAELAGDLSPTQERTTWRPKPDDAGLPVAFAYSGDWHAGDGGVAYRKLRDDLETIGETPGLYFVGMGDFVDGVSIHSKAAPALYGALFANRRFQDRWVLLRTKCIEGKAVAIMAGNHDSWALKHAAIETTSDFARALGAAYFPQGGGTIFAEVGTERYVIGVRHNGKGNSQLNPTNAQRRVFDDWPEWENCDVIALGHLHYNDMHIRSRKAGRCLYLRSGTYKLDDPHARDNGFLPEWGVPVSIFLPDEHRVIGFRGDDFSQAVQYLGWLRESYRRQAD